MSTTLVMNITIYHVSNTIFTVENNMTVQHFINTTWETHITIYHVLLTRHWQWKTTYATFYQHNQDNEYHNISYLPQH